MPCKAPRVKASHRPKGLNSLRRRIRNSQAKAFNSRCSEASPQGFATQRILCKRGVQHTLAARSLETASSARGM